MKKSSDHLKEYFAGFFKTSLKIPRNKKLTVARKTTLTTRAFVICNNTFKDETTYACKLSTY